MKKLYSKGKVHPSPPAIADHLSLLPATILTLTVALSPEDREVLAYLISCSPTSNNFSGQHKTTHKGGLGGGGGGGGSGRDHPPQFQCNCFRCYMSYWARWDTSPNRQLIHEIIDAYEDGLYQKKKDVKIKKGRRSKRVCNVPDEEKRDSGDPEPVLDQVSCSGNILEVKGEDGGQVGLENKGSVRRLVSFIGERIWGVWGI